MATENEKDAIQRRDEALDMARRFGQIPGSHHQAWVIDQMCRVLLGDEYETWVADAKAGEDGPDTYDWNTGIAP
ncbi:hypothetical protein [Pseudomonas sp.]|uniref:hypothetical protein n=1 Tax=Pseudomonas sp. TaxID=306 RepID=UPI00289CEA08|nr:hypothetical protein [Pseudomonas sp.]